MIMRMAFVNNPKTTVPETDGSKEFIKFMQGLKQLISQYASSLMSTLTKMKYDNSRIMNLEMTIVAAKLRTSGMNIDEYILVQFILNSLPPEQYETFQMNYNIM